MPELLSDGDSLYLIGYDTLGWQSGDGLAPSEAEVWTFVLPDVLGSVRQKSDAAGAVTAAREWSPYGEELGGAQAGLGFTGEWWDAAVGLQYLRARWYQPGTGRFTQVDPLIASAFYRYASNNPIIFTDPSGLCTDQPGAPYFDPPGTCRVDPGDVGLYAIARQHNVPESKILLWNPEYKPPYTIHVGNLVYLCDRSTGTCPGSTVVAPPGDWWHGTSGYLEGWMVSISGGAFGCGVEFVLGEEIVYDFARRPPERALFRFVSRERGLSGSPTTWFSSDFLKQWAIKGSLSVYAGFIWGFNDWSNIRRDYQGSATSGSVGLTFDIPAPQAPYISMGLGAGIGKFKSDTNQVQGYTGYVSGGVQVGLPSAGFGMATSVIKTNYTMHGAITYYALGEGQADLQTLGNHIRSGDGTPLVNTIVGYLGGPIVSELVRKPAADIGVHVVREHYAGGGR